MDGLLIRKNRKWLKEKGIRITAKPLGRPKAETPQQLRQRKQEQRERNQIEGKFGQAKDGYRLNQIRTRLQATAESWIGCIIFITNLIRWEKEFFGPLFSMGYPHLVVYPARELP